MLPEELLRVRLPSLDITDLMRVCAYNVVLLTEVETPLLHILSTPTENAGHLRSDNMRASVDVDSRSSTVALRETHKYFLASNFLIIQ